MDEKKKRFVRDYLKTLDPAGAARRAGFERAAETRTASRLLRQPEIGAAVKRGVAAERRRKLVSADRVLEELARIAFADIRDYASWDGERVTFRAGDEIPDDAAGAIAEISQQGGAPRIKLYDKKAALTTLARHLGLFAPRTETADPKAQHKLAEELRDTLIARIAALADAPDKPANGDAS